MKKCKGCGVILQSDDTKLAGYVKDLKQDYCMRCFRLNHYGDISDLKTDLVENDGIIKIYKEHPDALYVLITDVFDALNLLNDEILTLVKKRKVLLVITKIDLLPKNISDRKIDTIFMEIVSKLNGFDLVDVLLTYKDDQNFCPVFNEILEETGFKEVLFMGYANAGKSSLINRLMGNDDLTTSIYPGTTLMINEIEKDGRIFIDTPGIVDKYSYYTYLPSESLKNVLIRKTVKPAVYQAYEDQAYFVEGILRVEVLTGGQCNLVFFQNNELEVHRTKLENADNYQERHIHEAKLSLLPFKYREYHVKDQMSFYLKGLGILKVSGRCVIRLGCYENIRIFNTKGVI